MVTYRWTVNNLIALKIKIMKINNIYFSLLLLLCLSTTLFSQEDDSLDSESVEIIKKFEAQLAESDKLDINPSLPPVDSSNRFAAYQINAKPLLINYPAPDIKPIAMKSEELPEVKNAFFKGGAGVPNMYYGELSYFGSILDKVDFGAGAKYHRADNGKNNENQKFINTDAFLQGSYKINDRNSLLSKVDFREKIDHFFGYDNEIFSFEQDQVRQRFRTVNIATSYVSPDNDIEKFNYGGNVNLYTHGDLFDSQENGAAFSAKVNKYIKREHPLGLELIGDFSSFKDSTEVKQRLNIFTIRPTASFHAEKFKVLIGGNLVFHDSTFTALPIIEAIANIAGNQLVAFAGWEGNVTKNTYRTLTEYNPYLVSNPDLFNTTQHEYYGGLKGKIKNISYVAKGGYKTIEGLPLYLQNMNAPLRFDVISENANSIFIEATAEILLMKKLKVAAAFTKNFYELETQEQPWHVPSLEVNLNTRYALLNNKLALKAEFYAANPVANISENFTIEFLNTLYDVSVGAEYSINETIGAWVDVNNLTSTKYERWVGYRTFGTNFMGGVSVKF